MANNPFFKTVEAAKTLKDFQDIFATEFEPLAQKDGFNENILFYAVRTDKTEIVKYVIGRIPEGQRVSYLQAKNEFGKTAEDIAKERIASHDSPKEICKVLNDVSQGKELKEQTSFLSRITGGKGRSK